MNTSQFVAGIVLGAILVVIGTYWYQNSAGQSAAVVTAGEVRIGFTAPLSGPWPDWSESIMHGVQLGVADAKHQLRIDYQDDACDTKQSVGLAKKLSGERVRVIIMGCDDGIKAVLPVIKKDGTVILSASFLGDNTFDENPTNLINLSTQISTEADFMSAYLQEQGVQSVAIIFSKNVFGDELSRRMPEKLAARGIRTVALEGTLLGTTDFRTVIEKIRGTNPDAIYILQGAEQIGIFANQLRVVDKTTPLYGYYGIEADNALNSGGPALEGVVYTYPVNSAEDTAAKAAFDKRYSDTFRGKIPTATSYFMYDGIMLLDKALNVCSATDGQCIETFFKTYGPYEGLSGKMEIQPDGKNIRPFGIKKIENGEFVWVTKELNL